MNLETILALIAAIAAVISPVLTAFINSRNAYKTKESELFFEAKSAAYRDYLRYATAIKASDLQEVTIGLTNATAQAQLFSSSDTQIKIGKYTASLLNFHAGETELSQLAADATSAMLAMRDELRKPRLRIRRP